MDRSVCVLRAAAVVVAAAAVLCSSASAASPPAFAPGSSSDGYPPTTHYATSCVDKCQSGRAGHSISHVVFLSSEGGKDATIATEQNDSGKSIHYLVANDGSVGDFVPEADTAWYAGDEFYNQTSIGIIVEGVKSTPSSFGDLDYQRAAQLTAAAAHRYGFPIDAAHVLGRGDIATSTYAGDGPNPQPGFDLDRLRKLAQAYLDELTDSDGDGIVDSSDACPTQSDASAPRDPRNGCPRPPDTDGDGLADDVDACPTQSDAAAPANPRTGCPAVAPPDTTAPVISSFVVAPTAFVAARGTHVFYKLSEAATTTLTAERRVNGVRKHGRCVAGKPRKGGKSCARYVNVNEEITRADTAGLSTFDFAGRLGGAQLKPGSYRLDASARDAAGNISATVRSPFRIKRR